MLALFLVPPLARLPRARQHPLQKEAAAQLGTDGRMTQRSCASHERPEV